jgi:hypothetical protein
MLTRRRLWRAVLLSISIGYSHPVKPASISGLDELAKALGDAADCIGKLGDNVAHLVKLAVQGWDAASARRTRARLRDISARLSAFQTGAKMEIIGTIDDYIVRWNRLTKNGRKALPYAPSLYSSWYEVLSQISGGLTEVKALLTDVRAERSDLVNEPTYRDLLEALSERVRLFEKLQDQSAPMSRPEIDALKIVSANYKKLREKLKEAVLDLNLYLKDHNENDTESHPQSKPTSN